MKVVFHIGIRLTVDSAAALFQVKMYCTPLALIAHFHYLLGYELPLTCL